MHCKGRKFGKIQNFGAKWGKKFKFLYKIWQKSNFFALGRAENFEKMHCKGRFFAKFSLHCKGPILKALFLAERTVGFQIECPPGALSNVIFLHDMSKIITQVLLIW